MKLPSIHASMAFIITVSSLHNVSKAATARGRQLGCGTSTVLGRRRSRAGFVHHSPLLGHSLQAAKCFRSEAKRCQPYSFQRSRPLDLSAAPSGANHDGHRRNTSRSNSGSSSGSTANPIPTRRADDYDNTIFAPALPKESVSSKSMSSLENSRDASGESYGFFDSDYYSDESPDNSAVPKRLDGPPSNQQHDVSTQSDDVAAFRARYQFRFNLRREMPPPMSVYDDDDDDGQSNQYNWFDDDSGQSDANTYSNGWSEEGNIVKATARILKKEPSSTSIPESSVTDYEGWSEEGTIIKRTARILKSEKSSATTASPSNTAPRVVRTTARILPNTTSTSENPYASISQTEATPKIENEENFTRGQIPHRSLTSLSFVPSFMEPEKTKAMINDNDDSVRLSGERLTPSMPEASTGSGSTPYSTTLLYQIQHLTSQIYQLNDGVEFNIDSPKQVSRVLFGEEGFSTSKDTLEALASAGNQLAACIFKYRKVAREYKRELKRMEQMEKGDRKNDYYGNLARKAVASSSVQNTTEVELDETENITPSREPLLLIDASAYIFRAYHAIPPLHHSDGTPTAALHGVCRMLQNLLLNRLLRGERPRVVLVFDSKGTNFRHDLYPEYKANRGPCPEDLMPQFDLVREAAEAFGVVQVEAEGYEADDVIATLTLKAVEEGVDVDILSGDKDLMQLITPPNKQPSVHMIDPMHFDRVSHDDVIKKWGVPSEKLGDILALAGDASDNIPGAPGIGPKIAASLIDEFGCLDNLIQQADTIKQKKRRESLVENADKILLYRKIVTLDDTIPTDKMTLPPSFESVSDFRMSTFDPNK
eukprot:CCRYP_000505-RB/>CCRYP_000505-RB protein AED:0.24 eAED:0.24 QI:164/1/1/1/1/1/3/445/821